MEALSKELISSTIAFNKCKNEIKKELLLKRSNRVLLAHNLILYKNTQSFNPTLSDLAVEILKEILES